MASSLTTAERNATRDVTKYVLLLLQLAAALVVIYVFKLENRTFGEMSALVVGGFAAHYWLPFRWKKPCFVMFSMAAAFALLHHLAAAMLIGSGLVLYAILHLPAPYAMRAGLVAIIGAGCLAARNHQFDDPGLSEIMSSFWPVFGGIFMFRMMIYVYDLRQEKSAGTLLDYLAYFFILPNYYFLLFPVIDYQTMRSTYYSAEFHKQAQEGVRWIARGLSQLLIYRLIYHLRPNPSPDDVTSLGTLVLTMVLTYLLYLRLSGQYHVIIGMMHLFGFNLPETHRRFLFAESLTDFWRRINIYWKDFMVKMFYYPVFFRLRAYGDMGATAAATCVVFGLTWFLHAYQFYWLSGKFLLALHDLLFWAILGILVLLNVLYEMRPKPKTAARPKARWFVRPVKIAATFSLITVLWSMWNSRSLAEWVDMLTYWRVG